MNIDIHQLLITGTVEQIRLGDEKEKLAVGTLRAGNSGMMTESGHIVGSCAAEAFLRFKGINLKQVNLTKELMFAGGRGNEQIWIDSLTSAPEFKAKGLTILAEEQIPISWETDTGIKVTGRPDIIVCDQDKNPLVGIELKQIMSSYSAFNILFKNEPMLKHLMQAAHYMWQLNIPYELWYTNRTMITPDSFMGFSDNIPAPGEPLSEFINYRYYKRGNINPKTGKPIKHKLKSDKEYFATPAHQRFYELKKFVPFVKGFKLELREGRLWYQPADKPNARWTETCVNIPDIIRFYNYISELNLESKVPKPYINADIFGEDMGFSFDSELGEFSPLLWQGQTIKDWLDKINLYKGEI